MERPVSEFAKDRNRSDGTAIHCKPCRRAYYKANASTIQQKHRDWAKDPNNHVKMAEWYSLNNERRFFYRRANNVCGTGSGRTNQLEKAVDLARLWKRQRGVCAVTGWRLDRETAQLDHIQAKVNGGTNAIENLRWVHRDVNYAKRDLTDAAFFRLCSAVVDHQRSRTREHTLSPFMEGDDGCKHFIDLAEVDTAPVEQSAGDNGVNSAEAYSRKGHGHAEPSRSNAEGATTIPKGSRAKRPQAPHIQRWMMT
jgi:hypothetical protein